MNSFIRQSLPEQLNLNRVEFPKEEAFSEVWRKYETAWLVGETNARYENHDGAKEHLIYVKGIEADGVAMGAKDLKMIVDPKSGRRKFYLMQPSYGYNEVLADNLMILTATGDKPDRPMGHVHVENMQRWYIHSLSTLITEATNLTRTEPYDEYIETAGKDKQMEIRHRSININSGRVIASEILSGTQKGRAWSIYYPYGLTFDFNTPTANHSFDVQLGFGEVISQGNDKNKSPKGSTHILLANEGIRPNFIKYYAN
jgi:hypothetical protein